MKNLLSLFFLILNVLLIALIIGPAACTPVSIRNEICDNAIDDDKDGYTDCDDQDCWDECMSNSSEYTTGEYTTGEKYSEYTTGTGLSGREESGGM